MVFCQCLFTVECKYSLLGTLKFCPVYFKDSGHASSRQIMQIKRIKTKLGVNSISPVEALCTAGIQEAQHLNKEEGERESG